MKYPPGSPFCAYFSILGTSLSFGLRNYVNIPSISIYGRFLNHPIKDDSAKSFVCFTPHSSHVVCNPYLQVGEECYGGLSEPNQGLWPVSYCMGACHGDSSQMCGHNWALSVFAFTGAHAYINAHYHIHTHPHLHLIRQLLISTSGHLNAILQCHMCHMHGPCGSF